MAGKKKGDELAQLAIAVAILAAFAWLAVQLFKPLKCSTVGGKVLGTLGVVLLLEAILFLLVPDFGVLPLSFLPDPWTKAMVASGTITGIGFLVASIPLYVAGMMMKPKEELSGEELFIEATRLAPDAVVDIIDKIRQAFEKGGSAPANFDAEFFGLRDAFSKAGSPLDDAAFGRLASQTFGTAFMTTVQAALSAGKLSTNDWDVVHRYCEAFPNVFPREALEPAIRKMEATKAIERGELPVVEKSGILMKYPEEQCHWVASDVTLSLEQTKTLGYRGASVGTTIRVGGFPIRLNTFGGNVERRTEVSGVDTGDLFLTSHRLVFVGATKSSTIPLSKVVQVEADEDSDVLTVVVEAGSSKNLFFGTSDAAILAKLIETIQGGGELEEPTKDEPDAPEADPSLASDGATGPTRFAKRQIESWPAPIADLAKKLLVGLPASMQYHKSEDFVRFGDQETEDDWWVAIRKPGRTDRLDVIMSTPDAPVAGKGKGPTFMDKMKAAGCTGARTTYPDWDGEYRHYINCSLVPASTPDQVAAVSGFISWYLLEAPELWEE